MLTFVHDKMSDTVFCIDFSLKVLQTRFHWNEMKSRSTLDSSIYSVNLSLASAYYDPMFWGVNYNTLKGKGALNGKRWQPITISVAEKWLNITDELHILIQTVFHASKCLVILCYGCASSEMHEWHALFRTQIFVYINHLEV